MKTIFHTSFCASTYLAVSLSKSITTFCEPDCSYKLNSTLELNKLGDFLVKFPSSVCFLASQLNYKNVFLYRKLKDQLHKYKKNYFFYNQQLNNNYNIMKNNLHKKTKHFFYSNDFLLNSAFLWADRFNWLLDCKDVLYLETNDLLQNYTKKLNLICKFYEIEFKPVDVDFHVKKYNLNNKNESINIDYLKDYKIYDSSEGIEEYIFDEKIEEICNLVIKNFPELKKFI
jgi:hypothetical protein